MDERRSFHEFACLPALAFAAVILKMSPTNMNVPVHSMPLAIGCQAIQWLAGHSLGTAMPRNVNGKSPNQPFDNSEKLFVRLACATFHVCCALLLLLLLQLLLTIPFLIRKMKWAAAMYDSYGFLNKLDVLHRLIGGNVEFHGLLANCSVRSSVCRTGYLLSVVFN